MAKTLKRFNLLNKLKLSSEEAHLPMATYPSVYSSEPCARNLKFYEMERYSKILEHFTKKNTTKNIGAFRGQYPTTSFTHSSSTLTMVCHLITKVCQWIHSHSCSLLFGTNSHQYCHKYLTHPYELTQTSPLAIPPPLFRSKLKTLLFTL